MMNDWILMVIASKSSSSSVFFFLSFVSVHKLNIIENFPKEKFQLHIKKSKDGSVLFFVSYSILLLEFDFFLLIKLSQTDCS